MKLTYRPEIDGLRAIAVLPVILFHAGFTTFSGGFVGVDVFFVISGYLITSIIVKDVTAGTFSFWEFYERRARRILPALFLVMLCCIPFAWMWMMPKELKEFSASIVSVCLFASNFLFWQQSGYFDTASELKPLLHTWSLAVEEQYYIIFPIAVLLLWRLGRRNVIWSIALLAILSLAFSEYASRYYPSANFYLLPTRAWELMAGALCSFTLLRPNFLRDNLLSIAGLTAIIVSVFAYNDTIPFPSLFALLPVLGTCAVILFAQEGTIVRAMLSLKPVVGVGLISYSAYLWHQPLFAFARIRSITDPAWQLMLGLAAASLLLAYLSWKFVETPARKRGVWPLPNRATVFSTLGVAAAAFMTAGMAGQVSNGFPSRLPPSALSLLASSTDIGKFRNKCLSAPTLADDFVRTKCHLGAEGSDIDFLLFGDSFAGALADGINLAATQTGHAGLFFGLHSCLPVISIGGTWDQTRPACKPFQRSMSDIVKQVRPKIVVLHGAWGSLDNPRLISENDPAAKSGYDAFRDKVMETVKDLSQSGATVYVVCCIPGAKDGGNVPNTYAKLQLFGLDEDIRPTREQFEAHYKTARAIFESPDFRRYATFIDVTGDFCDAEKCELSHDGRTLLYDKYHLSKYGSERLSQSLARIFGSTAGTTPADD